MDKDIWELSLRVQVPCMYLPPLRIAYRIFRLFSSILASILHSELVQQCGANEIPLGPVEVYHFLVGLCRLDLWHTRAKQFAIEQSILAKETWSLREIYPANDFDALEGWSYGESSMSASLQSDKSSTCLVLYVSDIHNKMDIIAKVIGHYPA
jgi:hypothetical protein